MPLSKIDSDSLNSPITAVNLAYTGTLTGGTGVVNFGSGQFVKDANGNIGIGAVSGGAKLDVLSNSSGVYAGYYTFVGSGYGVGVRNSSGGSAALMYFFSPNYVGEISTNGTTTSFVSASDYRLKEAISPMTGALATVTALKPVTYKWKSNGLDGQGFIAHELQAVVPDCVTGEKDAVDAEGNPKYQGIDTSFLVATLTAAIQELKAIVDAQGAEIAALKGTP